ncbi:MAG: hypothetical protein MUQ10_00460 [Anaerolineae bacterium]|nr:hypothetical protein [Anaerolineae bacterium]
MPGIAVREFGCTLCRKKFTLLAGDLFVPEPDLCDECLGEIWPLEGEALVKYVAERWPDEEKLPMDSVFQYINQYKAQWPSAEEAIKQREQMRKAFG